MTDYDLIGAQTGPASSISEPGAQYTLAVEWYATGTAWLKGYRIWRPSDGGSPAITGPVVARTWTVGGAAVAGTDASFTLSGSGVQTALLSTPIAISIGSGNRYRSGAHFPNGAYPFTGSYFSSGPGSGGLVVGPLTAPNQTNATDGKQGVLASGSSINFPNLGSPQAAFYWITPILTDVDPGGESHSGSVTATLGLSSSSAGGKRVSAARSSVIALSGNVTGGKRGAGAPTSTLALSAGTSGTKRSGAAVSASLALSSSATGSSDSDGSAVRSQVLCSPWATPADLPENVRSKYSDAEWSAYLMQASEQLYYLSGRRWLGAGCTETAYLRSVDGGGTWPYHPSWGSCPCWSYGTWYGHQLLTPTQLLPGFVHRRGPRSIHLPMSPIGNITQVMENGEVLDPSRYRLTRNGWLTRVDDEVWSMCMDTTSITYTFGEAPPEGGVRATVVLAIELAAFEHGEECGIPANVETMTRQGITVTMNNPMEFLDDGRTGIPAVDMWLRAVNPQARGQRGSVWSPDIPMANL